MIFYFSGTGNSLAAARQMAGYCGDSVVSIADEMKKKQSRYEYSLEEGEAIGFVYPVYAWGPPAMVTDFIEKLSILKPEEHYVYSIATCGDNIGNTMDVLQRSLAKSRFGLDSGFSLVMPNTYIRMWDVDTEDEVSRRLAAADEQIRAISEIVNRRETGVFQIKKGPVPFLLTGIINPLFNRFAMSADGFYAEDSCTSCGLCEEICPTQNIAVKGKPVWGSDCTQCLACMHRCPEQAIQYGKKTKGRGRYVHPDLK
jgi:NAD-dependent dihydropyrimidine dehydrogenase PreA subunit